MRYAKLTFLFCMILFFVVLFVGFFLPSELHVFRSLVIKRDVATLFESIVNLKKRNEWSIWKNVDSTIIISYPHARKISGKGAYYVWTGDSIGLEILLVKVH